MRTRKSELKFLTGRSYHDCQDGGCQPDAGPRLNATHDDIDAENGVRTVSVRFEKFLGLKHFLGCLTPMFRAHYKIVVAVDVNALWTKISCMINFDFA